GEETRSVYNSVAVRPADAIPHAKAISRRIRVGNHGRALRADLVGHAMVDRERACVALLGAAAVRGGISGPSFPDPARLWSSGICPIQTSKRLDREVPRRVHAHCLPALEACPCHSSCALWQSRPARRRRYRYVDRRRICRSTAPPALAL